MHQSAILPSSTAFVVNLRPTAGGQKWNWRTHEQSLRLDSWRARRRRLEGSLSTREKERQRQSRQVAEGRTVGYYRGSLSPILRLCFQVEDHKHLPNVALRK